MKSFLIFTVLCLGVSSAQNQNIITAESGQDVTLPCGAPNKKIPVIATEWSRADLESEYVLLYRDGHFDQSYQHPSFKNRVDLQDHQMKDGNVSLVLKDVMADDAGTYECHVFQRGANHRRRRAVYDTEPIKVISLRVDPPGSGGSIGLAVAAVVLAVAAAAAVGFVIYRRRTRQQSDASPQPPPPVELQLLEHV